MLNFDDFATHVNKYRLRKWKIVRCGRRAASLFVQHFVLGITSHAKTHKKVISRTNSMRKQWEFKLKDIIGRSVWFPNAKTFHPLDPLTLLTPDDADFKARTFDAAYRRCLFCRPTYVYFKWAGDKVFRPCGHSNICPFCWARVSAYQYRRVKSHVRTLVAENPLTAALATTRVIATTVDAPDFHAVLGCSPAQFGRYIGLLESEIAKHRRAYKKCVQRLKRNTESSMWRIVVSPSPTGWVVETRQFFIREPNKKMPSVQLWRGAKVTYLKSIALSQCHNKTETPFFNILGAFAVYPQSLLTGYSELVAVYLRASHKCRLNSGTGSLRKTGRRLCAVFKKKAADAAAVKAEKAAAQQRPAVSHDQVAES